MDRFLNKVAVITGGGSGIGLAAAARLRAEGATVVITGRDPAALARAPETLGGDTEACPADVTSAADLDRLFETARGRHGRVDVLFVNAGVALLAPATDTTEALFDRLLGTNLRAAFFTAQKALPLLADGGAVVLNTSFFAEVGVPGTAALAASKAGVRSLTRTLAAELVGRGVRVNSVSPGAIDTPIYGKLGLPPAAVEEIAGAIQGRIPMGRFGRPEEVAAVVAFLASADASYMTGCDLAVDGGRTQL